MPAARSSAPAMALNCTWIIPSCTLVPSLSRSGKVACPDCLTTREWDGAPASSSTVHRGAPVPVFVTVQPRGARPSASASKLTLSAMATAPSATRAAATAITWVMNDMPTPARCMCENRLSLAAIGLVLREVRPQVGGLLFVLDSRKHHLGAGNLGARILDVILEGLLA